MKTKVNDVKLIISIHFMITHLESPLLEVKESSDKGSESDKGT